MTEISYWPEVNFFYVNKYIIYLGLPGDQCYVENNDKF